MPYLKFQVVNMTPVLSKEIRIKSIAGVATVVMPPVITVTTYGLIDDENNSANSYLYVETGTHFACAMEDDGSLDCWEMKSVPQIRNLWVSPQLLMATMLYLYNQMVH